MWAPCKPTELRMPEHISVEQFTKRPNYSGRRSGDDDVVKTFGTLELKYNVGRIIDIWGMSRSGTLIALKPVHTVAEKCDSRRISPLSRRFRRQSHFSATVSLFCDIVDRALSVAGNERLRVPLLMV